MKLKFTLGLLLLFWYCLGFGQEVSLLNQFNGRFDYTAIGNTLNTSENGGGAPCEILTSSSADLFLEPDQTVINALLYWAGSGDGDFEVQLNGNEIRPDRTFALELDEARSFFAAVTDVTELVQSIGSDTYTLSELDLSEIIETYCPTGTNFAGWSIVIVFEDPDLPLNQLNVYEGLERVPDMISIELESLNVLDDEGAKIGFLAWEGDAALSVTETLTINGDVISNPPLNPADNAFNSTNSFTGSDVLYNMDIDFYSIEDNIEPGDTSAVIQLTSGQDFVMINNIVTVLNSQLPDATATIDSVVDPACGIRQLEVDFTIYNENSTDVLPAATPIAFYADAVLIGSAATVTELPIDGQESQSIVLNIPDVVPNEFNLRIVADDNGSGVSTVAELNELNNEAELPIRLLKFPEFPTPQNLERCDAVGDERFDLNTAMTGIDAELILSFHESEADANSGDNPIVEPSNYLPSSNPQTIYVRVANADCFVVDSFEIEVIICPLPDATVSLPDPIIACRGRVLSFELRVSNTDGTAPLPAGTPIALYADGAFILGLDTPTSVPLGGFIDIEISLILDPELPDSFSLLAVADDLGDGNSIIEELDETNNTFKSNVNFQSIPQLPELPNQLACDQGFDSAEFDLTNEVELLLQEFGGTIRYYTSASDALIGINPIVNTQRFTNTTNPQEIFVRVDNEICFDISSFELRVENCPPLIPQGFSPNTDGINDTFEIQGLLDIFPDHRLEIYSRLGNLIFVGSNETGHWNGIPNRGLAQSNEVVPPGVYYYVLFLADENFDTLSGWLYLNRD
ncbi:gliding motility-associated C-terminal domain-containing protein [Gilvibacter sediminis]|uniref:T9SS type B sorting domain-containing protein n=1 Tax=Gilvibacter sediminis TaxID=379071 RepID=UPI002350FC08|nr:gliding motility-associated C-terminal domain-containing protein [Gilvibacter sediminis]MDC7998860.1 gliding motility-associated C-terminal domain-containing protein [Gilvibacter sediminis]